MLQPTINNSALRTGSAVPAEAEGAVPGDFAALLALDLSAATPQAPFDGIVPALPGETATRQPELPSGKILPEALPVTLPVELQVDFPILPPVVQPIKLPAVSPVAVEPVEQVEAEAEVDVDVDVDTRTEPALPVDQPNITPIIVLTGIPELPLTAVAIETVAEQTARAQAGAAAEQANVPQKAQAEVTDRPAAAPKAAIEQPSIRFVEPDPAPQAAAPATETAKLVAARSAAQSAADLEPRQAADAVAMSVKASAPKSADRGDMISAAIPASPVAAEAQPATLVRDLSFGAASPQTAPLAAPTVAARPAPHDFATLVDRLIEARDAAGANQVTAAVAHSDFGRVSLRFSQDGGAMSVAMTSADPGFAPAVAAAAAGAQTATPQQDNTQRSDQSQQQSGQTSAQAQSQGQSQGSTRGGERAAQQTFARNGDSRSETPADAGEPDTRRRGIYA